MATDYSAPAPGQYQETTTTSSSSDGVGLDRTYIKTVPSLLKIAEMVLDLVAFICASANIWWAAYGGGWVQFVTISALITTLLFFLFHLFRVLPKLPGPWILIEFIYYIVYTGLLLIAAIVAAARTNFVDNSAIIATAIFTFACVAVYAVDAFFMFRRWQDARFSSGGTHTTSSTTTTTTTYETRTQY